MNLIHLAQALADAGVAQMSRGRVTAVTVTSLVQLLFHDSQQATCARAKYRVTRRRGYSA
jgi:hypothetical protein